jgi:hypothetical protein
VVARLAELYRAADLMVDEDEPPDYLPMVLEYAAFCADDWLLIEHRGALGRIWSALHGRGAPHAWLVEAVLSTLPARHGTAKGPRTGAPEGPIRDPYEGVGQATFSPEPLELPELAGDEASLEELELELESDLAVEDSDLPFEEAEEPTVEDDLPEPRLSVR